MRNLDKQLKQVKGTLEIEGLYLTEKMEELIIKEAQGEISSDEFQKQVKELAQEEE